MHLFTTECLPHFQLKLLEFQRWQQRLSDELLSSEKLRDEHREKRRVDADRDGTKRATGIGRTTWFHHDRRAAREGRATHSHEIRQHNDPNTGFPILASDPPKPPATPTALLSIQPSTVPKRRGRVDMKALICWPLCSELLCLSACWSCSPAHPHSCRCSRP